MIQCDHGLAAVREEMVESIEQLFFHGFRELRALGFDHMELPFHRLHLRPEIGELLLRLRLHRLGLLVGFSDRRLRGLQRFHQLQLTILELPHIVLVARDLVVERLEFLVLPGLKLLDLKLRDRRPLCLRLDLQALAIDLELLRLELRRFEARVRRGELVIEFLPLKRRHFELLPERPKFSVAVLEDEELFDGREHAAECGRRARA